MKLSQLLKIRYGVDTIVDIQDGDTIVYFNGSKYLNFFIKKSFNVDRRIVNESNPIEDWVYPILRALMEYDDGITCADPIHAHSPSYVLNNIKDWYYSAPHITFREYMEKKKSEGNTLSNIPTKIYIDKGELEIIDINLKYGMVTFEYARVYDIYKKEFLCKIIEHLTKFRTNIVNISPINREIVVKLDVLGIDDDPIRTINAIMTPK